MPIVSHRNISDDDIHIPFLTSSGSPEGDKDGLINHFCLDVSNEELYRKVSNSGGNTGWQKFAFGLEEDIELRTMRFETLSSAPTATAGKLYFDGNDLFIATE